METVCDGIYDCDNDADEENCESMNSSERIPEYSEASHGNNISTVLISINGISTTEVSTTETSMKKLRILKFRNKVALLVMIKIVTFRLSMFNTTILIVILLVLSFVAHLYLRNRN